MGSPMRSRPANEAESRTPCSSPGENKLQPESCTTTEEGTPNHGCPWAESSAHTAGRQDTGRMIITSDWLGSTQNRRDGAPCPWASGSPRSRCL
ncbi:hypothetical protein Cadr_000002177 [Camelus dromedarius]|uniref:Uncharacterized protein n=1 Tax=Camelus dromedarius TaxID=9838 RepID=A0A5N4EHN1_CAMDR|nr:hypothetical protein Cadr_000002177 [Camelus dromedarius]